MSSTINVFQPLPDDLTEEAFTELLRRGSVRIERIVSAGHASPEGFWYDQDGDEWVIVLEGAAAIQFDHEPAPVELTRGAYLNIPAHRRHRVAWTSPTEKTVWLAVHST